MTFALQYRTKKLWSSKIRRALRWEFWPMPIFYTPIVVYIIYLSLRYRGMTFLSVNPGMPMSGLIGERKADALSQLQGSPFLARFVKLNAHDSLQTRFQQATGFMLQHALQFPVVLKPDFGQRGQGVAVIRDQHAMFQYLAADEGDVLIQEHIEGAEFGVFYMRYPADDSAIIFSITEKTFPVLTGDGQQSLEQLLMENSRTHYMAEFLLELHESNLDRVLVPGEQFKVVEIGSHCRGSVFLDGNRHKSKQLLARMHRISQKIEGFCFGRFDIRAKDAHALSTADDFKILEINGVTSESTDVYDPKNSVFDAYRVLFSQWRAAFEIGRQNIHAGSDRVSILELLSHLKMVYRRRRVQSV